jgi:exodeoxyribonuclease VII small subunit
MAKEKTQQDLSKMSFEQALEELKTIVEQLETGETRLDDAIAAYERGSRLKRHCEDKLREAQAKIEKISLGTDGEVASEPFDAE